jgi:hypothetical protein
MMSRIEHVDSESSTVKAYASKSMHWRNGEFTGHAGSWVRPGEEPGIQKGRIAGSSARLSGLVWSALEADQWGFGSPVRPRGVNRELTFAR